MRAKVALFYNPVAGGGNFKNRLDEVFYHLQNSGLEVIPWRIDSNRQINIQVEKIDPTKYHTIIAAGGDGTIHGVVNALMRYNLNIPLGIFPEGTSNDLAQYLKIPSQVDKYCQVITNGKLVDLDLGKVNGEYFINVASAGFLTDTAHEVNYNIKNSLGKIAYYLKAMEKIPRMKSLHLNLDVDGKPYDMEILLFLLLNGGNAGGFKDILPEGTINDGRLDFLAIKPVLPLGGLDRILFNYSRGQILKDENVFYCQGHHFSLNLDPPVETDLDGEQGPDLPWEITVCPRALQLRVPQ